MYQSSAIDALREATKTQHLALHRHPQLLPLTRGVTLPQYLVALQGFYAFHRKIDQAVMGDATYQRCACPQLQWLSLDLSFYQQLPQAQVRAETSSVKLPSFSSTADVLGLLYVKEGSLLGGQTIVKCLRASLTGCDHSFAFFDGLGPSTINHWQTVVQKIEALNPQELDKACNTAVATFHALEQLLNEPPIAG